MMELKYQLMERKPWLFIGFVAILATWNTRFNEFVWDDRAALILNQDIRAVNWTDLFLHDFWGTPIHLPSSHKSYRPLTVLTFRLNFFAHGLEPQLYHLVNGFLHMGCSILVWKTAQIVFSNNQKIKLSHYGSIFAGLLFAVHPIHCDAVASVVGRADLLCTFFSLISFLVYAQAIQNDFCTKWSSFFFALLMVVVASLCKELGFTTLGLLVGFDLTLFAMQPASKVTRDVSVRALQQRMTMILGFSIPAAIIRVWINGEHGQHDWNKLANHVFVEESKMTRVLSYAHLHAWYLWKLVWPSWLCFDYGFNTIPIITSILDNRNLLTLFAYTVVLVGTMYSIVKLPHGSPLFMSILFGVIPFVPASNLFFPVGTVVAERLLYFPSVGFCLLIGYGLQQVFMTCDKYRTQVPNKFNHASLSSTTDALFFFWCHRIIRICCGCIILAGWYRSHIRNAEWRDETTLFKAAISVAPTNVKVLGNYAKTLINSDPKKAIQFLKISERLHPIQSECHLNLGLSYSTLGNYLMGNRHLIKAMAFGHKNFVGAGYLSKELFNFWRHTNRGKKGKEKIGDGFTVEDFKKSPTIAEAKKLLEKAIDKGTYYPSHFLTRGLLSYHSGEYEDGLKYFEMSDRANLGIRERKMDLELIVEQWLLYNMVAVSYKAIGKTKEAIHFLLEGIEKHPQCTSLHINAAIIYYDAKESDKAFSHAKRILQIVKDQQDEDTIEMLQNAADLFVAVGFLQGALLLYEQVFSCLFLMQQQEKIIIVKEQQEEIQSKIQEIKHYLGSTTS